MKYVTDRSIVPGEEVESIVRRLRIDTNDCIAEAAMEPIDLSRTAQPIAAAVILCLTEPAGTVVATRIRLEGLDFTVVSGKVIARNVERRNYLSICSTVLRDLYALFEKSPLN